LVERSDFEHRASQRGEGLMPDDQFLI